MRQALNENPLVQVAIVGVLAVVVGFMLITRVAGGDGAEEAPSEPSATPSVAAPDAEPATGASAAEGVATPGAETPVPDVAAAVGEFTAGPGLPAELVSAYEDGDAVAVLITRERGIEDRRLRAMIGRIEAVGDVTVFHAFARDIADFSRVTGGVDVSRVPALVVIRPKGRGEAGTPLASVAYGFRGSASAEQAVRDALYEGRRDLPYHPR